MSATDQRGTGQDRAAPSPVTLAHGPVALLRGVLDRPLASYYLLLASSTLLLLIGLVMVFSATSVESYVAHGDAYASVRKQAVSAVVGLVVFWIFQRLPARTYRDLGGPLLIASAIMLALLDVLAFIADLRTPPGGTVTPVHLGPLYGDGLWLYLGPLQLQPAEIAKLALALWAARLLARKGPTIGWWRELATPLFPVAGGIMVLVGINDLGTMLCLLILFVGLLWSAGVRLGVFAAMSAVALGGIGMLVALPGKAKYRGSRLTSFLDPASCNQQLDCYQARQGKYAIADGGWFGVGLGESRGKWGWLPNGHNDFIFAVIAEELGVVGSFVVLALFAVLAYTGLRIARRVNDPFRRMVAAGITFWLVGQAMINVGGVIGLLPITGLPLPFISDGGSALVVTMAAVGLLASFARAEPDAARALHARPPAKWMRLVWAPLPPLPGQRRPRPSGGAAGAKGTAGSKVGRPAAGRGDAERRR